MLETIRQYAEERLEASGDGAATSQAHLEWCAALALEAGNGLRSGDDAVWIARTEHEVDNIRAALNVAVSSGDLDAATTLLASTPIGALWDNRLGASMAALAKEVAPVLGEPDHPVSAALLSLLALDAALRFAGQEAVEPPSARVQSPDGTTTGSEPDLGWRGCSRASLPTATTRSWSPRRKHSR